MKNFSHFNLLVIDDDSLIIRSLKLILPSHWKMVSMQNLSSLQNVDSFHAAFVDMHLQGNTDFAEGPEFIRQLHLLNPHIEIIAMSGDLSIELMEQCLNNGAQRYLAKPLMPEEILSQLEKIEAKWLMKQIESRMDRTHFRWIGNSSQSVAIKKQIAELRGERNPILIEGETGSGKEVIFKILNQQEPLRPFVAVNISAISENLFESEMFGHTRGAFTGADQMKIGLAEAANGGDLFLDEIEALSLPHQVKLLRFLESGEVRKVGSKETLKIQTRVICATNESLEDLVKEGKFRKDLLFRLKGQHIVLPPLRNRIEDIEDLAHFFLELQKPRINKILSKEALEELKKYSWPGNVRELKRICEQLSIIARLPIIRAEDVQQLLGTPHQLPQIETNDQELKVSVPLSQGLHENLIIFEKSMISYALQQTKTLEEACQFLKISRSSLYKKIKDFDLEILSEKK